MKSQSTFKSIARRVGQLALVFIVMLVAFVVSTSFVSTGSSSLSAEETNQSGLALLVVSFIDAMILAYLIRRSTWRGLKLVGAVGVVHFGIETFMTQIETLFFNSALQMPTATLSAVVLAGFLRAVIFAPLAVLILGRWRGAAESVPTRAATLSAWLIGFSVLAILYVLVYFAFGYFVAWQFPDVRQFYSGSTTIKPFLTHIADTLSANPILPLFQIFRGVLWAALALLIVRMLRVGRAEICVAVALAMAILISSALLFPNPYMPASVRFAHSLELTSSMFVFGALAGWLLTRPIQTQSRVNTSSVAPA